MMKFEDNVICGMPLALNVVRPGSNLCPMNASVFWFLTGILGISLHKVSFMHDGMDNVYKNYANLKVCCFVRLAILSPSFGPIGSGGSCSRTNESHVYV